MSVLLLYIILLSLFALDFKQSAGRCLPIFVGLLTIQCLALQVLGDNTTPNIVYSHNMRILKLPKSVPVGSIILILTNYHSLAKDSSLLVILAIAPLLAPLV